MEEIAQKALPSGMRYEWTGISLEQQQAGSQTLTIFVLGIVFVFLVLAAQYESFKLPFVIILAVPLAILGALGLQVTRGYVNDVFCQVGLVMLIGLASKNAILIVEFAEQLRRKGKAPVDAVIEAASIRLRPILMTSIAFLLGVVPLMLASGAGAAARNSLGTVVFGGMLVSTIVNLVFTPGLYVVLQRRPAGAARVGQLSGEVVPVSMPVACTCGVPSTRSVSDPAVGEIVADSSIVCHAPVVSVIGLAGSIDPPAALFSTYSWWLESSVAVAMLFQPLAWWTIDKRPT
jgi:HAE1 family hydrophobic/amphiphilic exporter-1